MHAQIFTTCYIVTYLQISTYDIIYINLKYLRKKHPSHKLGYKNIEKNKQLLYNYVLELPRIPVTNQDVAGILDPEKNLHLYHDG